MKRTKDVTDELFGAVVDCADRLQKIANEANRLKDPEAMMRREVARLRVALKKEYGED